jgi:type IV secretory pathway VirB10-like protein
MAGWERRPMRKLLIICLGSVSLFAAGQAVSPARGADPPPQQTQTRLPGTPDPGARPSAPELTAPELPQKAANQITVPAGTRVPVVLNHAISTKNAREGDNVYAVTNFPVVINGKVAIPPGTYVQGVITRSKRPGRVKGKGELLVHFNSLIFPNGYTLLLPGALENVPGEDVKMKGPEGTVEGPSGKGKDVGTVAKTTGAGAGIGGLATQSARGVGIGAGAGAVAGLGAVLLTRGPDLTLAKGTTLEMVLERGITIDQAHAERR